MTAHDDLNNSDAAGHALPSSRPDQQRILYLGRSIATAEALQSLLADGLRSGGDQKGNAPDGAVFASRPVFEVVTNQKMALRRIVAQPPSLVLVETSSQRDSRLRFCQALRLRLPAVAIVAVAGGRGQEYDFPFDAQVRTPVEPAEALASLRMVHANTADALLRRGPITLDMAGRRVSSPKGEREMTPKQCALLEMLMRNEHVVRRAEIMQAIWETSYLEDTRTLDVHIHWLREMIEPEPAYPVYLLTRRGVGYQFTVPDEHA